MTAECKSNDTAHYVERNDRKWGLVAASLEKLGLTIMAGVKSYRGEVIKNHTTSNNNP